MPYQNITLAQLLTRLARRYDQAVFWTPTAATAALAESVRIWNLITGISRQTVNVSTVVDDPYIVLPIPQQWLKVTRVRIPSPARELNLISLAGLDSAFPGWETHTTLTALGLAAPRYWAPVGTTRIAIYPADTTVLAGGNGPRTLAVDGIACANVLSISTDYLDLGDEELTVILGYALHVLSFSKGAEALTATTPLYLALLKAAADRNAVFAASSFYRRIIGGDLSRSAYPLRAQSSLAAAAQLEPGGNRGQSGSAAGPAGATGPAGAAGLPE